MSRSAFATGCVAATCVGVRSVKIPATTGRLSPPVEPPLTAAPSNRTSTLRSPTVTVTPPFSGSAASGAAATTVAREVTVTVWPAAEGRLGGDTVTERARSSCSAEPPGMVVSAVPPVFASSWRAAAGSVTVIAIEHNMQAIMSLSDRIVVIDSGKVIAEGKPDAVVRERRVIEAYLGEDFVDAQGL